MGASALQAQTVALFGENGAFAKHLSNYKLRREQVDMAAQAAAAIEQQSILVAEAGTGTGKTFAYLTPALLSGAKTIVSTASKALQDQLFFRDIPTVRAALAVPITVRLLKGRANYLCLYRLQHSMAEGEFTTRTEVAHLRSISQFARQTRSGDKAECAEVPENSPVWRMVTSSRENCLGQECPNHGECFVLAARKEALLADLLVVNHHLLFADMALRDEGMAELLPACNTVIIDEAHQIPEIATQFFGEQFSTGQLVELARDTKNEGLEAAPDFRELQDAAHALDKASRDLRLSTGVDSGRYTWAQMEQKSEFSPALQHVQDALDALLEILKTQAARSEGLARCATRALEQRTLLQNWLEPAPGYVRWAETFSQSLHLNHTPLSISGDLQKRMGAYPRAWILTSATLAVQRDFSHYLRELGLDTLDKTQTACWPGPFNYPEQAILYAPQQMPTPHSPDYAVAVAHAAWPVLEAIPGGAFFLCTTLATMRRVHEHLAELMAGTNWPLLLQGESSKGALLHRFRTAGKAVLVGSQSFWEGIDVRGEALSLVVIDKLPFAPPDDPVLAARIASMNMEGKNAFEQYQLPQAAISVKQGAGRLIRDENDRGVLMICDPRLISKGYGKRIWRSLPPMQRSRELSAVLAFLS